MARTKKKRWCMQHVCTAEVMKTHYITPKGPRSYPKKWPPKVRMMARMSFLFQFMEPDDLTVLRTFIREDDVLATGVLDPMRFTALFVAHLIKWPPAVAKWSDWLFENPLEQYSCRVGLPFATSHSLVPRQALARDIRPHEQQSDGRPDRVGHKCNSIRIDRSLP